MNFSWAMDLDPKGVNNQIKEAIDKRYATEEDDTLARLTDTSELQYNYTVSIWVWWWVGCGGCCVYVGFVSVCFVSFHICVCVCAFLCMCSINPPPPPN